MTCRLMDFDEWLRAWQELPADRREVYFHPHWSAAAAKWEKARPACLRAQSAGGWMLCPVLLHPIDDVCDAQTPYGYGGPIFVGQWSDDDKRRALVECGEALRGEGAVAEFVRCHTHWCDVEAMRAAGYRVFQVRTNVECALEAEDFTVSWAGSARRNLRKAISAGLRFHAGDDEKDWAAFEAIYAATARRLGMAELYRFDHAYCSAIARVPGVRGVVVAEQRHGDTGTRGQGEVAERRQGEEGEKAEGRRQEDEKRDGSLFSPQSAIGNRQSAMSQDSAFPVAAAVVLMGGKVAHYHLGGSDFSVRHLRPNDMLYFAMAQVARLAGCSTIVWGGGMSNDPQDSLLRFKSHFGNARRPVYCAGRVLDQAKYDALCAAWASRNPGRETKMFLRYRA